jgi:prepilin-type N-terminal cleavage/methylation domain-containing protein
MKFFFYNKNKKVCRAFTLLETLTAIAIISAVVMGPLTVAVNSSSYARQTKDVMSSVYLAEETIELLHHQQDSLYVACLKGVDPCGVGVPIGDETVGETAWRLFKERLDGISDSCFAPSECSYDFQDMLFSSTTPPTKYATSTTDCPELVLMSAPMVVNGDILDILRKFYTCSGIVTHMAGATVYSKPHYSRIIQVESIPTFETASSTYYYHDDLRVTSTITFRGSNGRNRQVKVVDFFHARS